MEAGRAWAIDAFGCDADRLRRRETLARIFREVVVDLSLRPVAPPAWHAFPGPGGITGFAVLSESHLCVHTFPETGFAAFDLYCCVRRPDWPWAERLALHLGAERVRVRRLDRGIPVATAPPAP
jgi:S-adenosylmethionine decarboxylase